MIKAKTYNVADTNLANFGTQLEKDIKAAAANKEPAWENAGKSVGLNIWRIEKFQVKAVPENTYGTFYSGDSYIVLRTYKNPGSDKLLYDVHFWLGSNTSQDEAGTAAYKTVELDDKLGGAPVQYREVQNFESAAFVALFPKGVKTLAGGVDTGFNHVKPTEYKPRLLHIRGLKGNVIASEVDFKASEFNNEDSFIADMGLKLYQWSGSKASAMEKNKAAQLARAIDDERAGKATVVVCVEGNDNEMPWAALGGKPSSFPAAKKAPEPGPKKLFRVSDASGKLTVTEVASGKTPKSKLDHKDVFILDNSVEVYIWVGSQASPAEKKVALQIATDYLKNNHKPLTTPIVRVVEGAENEYFHALLD